MRHALLPIAVPSIIMASGTLLLGTILASIPTPTALPDASSAGVLVAAGTCVEAAVTPFGVPGLAGRATLCDNGFDLSVNALVSGLTSGDAYTVWLGHDAQPPSCREASCRAVATPGDAPTSSMQQIARASVASSGILELAHDQPDVRLLHGSRIVLQILGERGRAGPYAQAIFLVP
jgi:hypothetical protein